jgi:RecB family exonuclease
MSWSYSKLLDFEQCRYRFRLKHIDKVPEEKHEAADRGTAIHTMAENFVLGKTKTLNAELHHFADDFIALRRMYVDQQVSLEGEWGFDKEWMPAAYRTAWLRMKADAVAFKQKDHAIVIDYKTGKKWGNEVKHGEQVQLYALATAIRQPEVKDVTVELWYLDKDELTTVHYTREHVMTFVKPFHNRAVKIDKAFDSNRFEPNPNQFTCQWCPYGPNKGKQCEHGVTSSLMSISDYRKKYS